MKARRTDTPWGLSKREQEVLDLVCIAGGSAEAAKALSLEPASVSQTIGRARDKMNATTNLRALLMWDRFAMGRDEGAT